MDEKNVKENTSSESNQDYEDISNIDINDSSGENEELNDREKLLEELRSQQNFPFAVIGGLLAAVISAFLWAVITVTTEYQVGYLAIAIGLIVGFAIRFLGAGVDRKFGILGSFLSLFGCLLGNLFSQIGFIAHEYSYAYLEVLSYLDFSTVVDIMVESFHPMDIVFYVIAMSAGYRFSFYGKASQLKNKVIALGIRWRMPLTVVAALLLIVLYFVLKQGYSGVRTDTYESGQVMSKGNIKNGKYDGMWTFYREDGTVHSIGDFRNGLSDGEWLWFTEDGNIERVGSYSKGLENGIWKNYYENGSVYDSVAYKDGRLNGEYLSQYETGNVYQIGNYMLDKKDGIWRTFHENGQLWSVGEMKDDEYFGDWIFYFENGNIQEELCYTTENKVLIKNRWDSKGNQTIKDGNGQYFSYSDDNKTLLSKGEVKNGEKTGVWKTYFPDGKLNEEGFYDNNRYKLVNVWNSAGEQTVKDGNGRYILYWDNDSVYMVGNIENGFKNGIWVTHDIEGKLTGRVEYLDDELHGKIGSFFGSGQVSFEGEYSNGIRQGKWTWYYEDGSLSSTVQFVNDKKEGIQLFHDVRGNPVKEEEYESGVLVRTKILN
jgi:antitoxin component YwqK of YwqJK toxin-antitoxin module